VENRVLKARLGGRRLRLTDTERRRLAALAHPLGRQRLKEVATLVTPDTLMRWYKRLIAQKFDGSKPRRQLGRPRVAEEIERLVVRMAEELSSAFTARKSSMVEAPGRILRTAAQKAVASRL
jgi:putative transposase